MNDTIRDIIYDFGYINNLQHKQTKEMLDRLIEMEELEDMARANNWNACMETTFKQLMQRDERIGEALIDLMRQIRQDIDTISKQEHKGTDFLNMLGRMVRITGLCEEIGLIDCGRMSYRHTRQYFINADGDLSNGL